MVIKRTVLDELGKMGLNDLIELNHLVVGMIKHKRSHEAYAKSMTFKVGDKVSFTSRRTGRKVGEIVKRNPRKAVVAVKNFFGNSSAAKSMASTTKWSVPYEMLTAIPKGQ